MNVMFASVFILANLILLFLNPDGLLSALLDGASKSATLCLSLIATYSVWLGLMEIWKRSGVTRVFSKLLQPIAKRLFKTNDSETLDCLCMNLSVNLLGVSGAGTPYGIQTAKLLDGSKNAEYDSAMLFVLNATSLQLIPTSIIGIRVALSSAFPADIVLPTLLSTLFSTFLGIVLTKLLIPPIREKRSFSVTCTQKARGQV